MTEEAYTGVPLHEGTIVLNAEGVRDPIVLVVTPTVDRLATRIRCRMPGPHTDCVPPMPPPNAVAMRGTRALSTPMYSHMLASTVSAQFRLRPL